MSGTFEKISRNILIAAFTVAASLSAKSQTSPPSRANTENVSAVRHLEILPAEKIHLADSLLIQEARDNFMELLPYIRNDYSARLKKLQDSTNTYLGRQGMRDRPVIVFDPIRFDVMEALSLCTEETSGEMVSLEIHKPSPQTLANATAAIGKAFSLPTGDPIYVEEAHAYYHALPDGSPLTTIVPIAPHALPYNIEGLTVEENVTFANKHEAWHCIDFLLRLTEGAFDDLPGARDKGTYRTGFRQEEARSLIIRHNREAFADIAALGDMIREGKNTDIIDAVIVWRTSFSSKDPAQADDVGHFTTIALREFNKRLGKIGIQDFRRMDENEARALYLDIIIDKGLSPKLLRKALGYEKNVPDPDNPSKKAFNGFKSLRRLLYKAEKLVDRETRDMFELRALMADRQPKDYLPLTESQDAEIDLRLKDWQPEDILYDHSIRTYGKITPVTLIQSYCSLQDALLCELTEDASQVNYIVSATKMAQLRRAFIQQLDTEDYLLLNAERGVDLLKTEKCLQYLAPGGILSGETPSGAVKSPVNTPRRP